MHSANPPLWLAPWEREGPETYRLARGQGGIGRRIAVTFSVPEPQNLAGVNRFLHTYIYCRYTFVRCRLPALSDP